MMYAFPEVLLHFAVDGRSSGERTLLRYAEEYEQAVNGGRRTYAQDGEVRLEVNYYNNKAGVITRRERIRARGAGARAGEQQAVAKVLDKLRGNYRFVLVESGESLESLLAGRFREILHLVIRDHLKTELLKAEANRSKYVEDLQHALLAPLRESIKGDLAGVFAEIVDVSLVPDVPLVEATLSNVEIRLTDAVETALAGKGTGVRGGVLVAMLRYLADRTRRSMIFAIEEPETFLHPAAQEGLRDGLEVLAARKDVTLLISTHSPYILSRASDAQVVALARDDRGLTRIMGCADGDAAHSHLVASLFRDPGIAILLEKSAEIPTGTRAVVVAEGTTDVDYLKLAATSAARPDLLEGLHLLAAGGATKLAAQALIANARDDRTVVALLDSDQPGKKARDMLVDLGFAKRSILLYHTVMSPKVANDEVEAEDLLPNNLLLKFISDFGEANVLSEKCKRSDGQWHFGFNQLGKSELTGWLATHAKASDWSLFVSMLESIRDRAGLTSTS
jgi:5S rRNA maturation endonuclease (ribonuclease M5)